jgi:hypothetical protein
MLWFNEQNAPPLRWTYIVSQRIRQTVNGTKNKGQGTENANIEQPLGDVVAFAAGVVGRYEPASSWDSA